MRQFGASSGGSGMSFDVRTERVRDLLSSGVLWVEDGNHGENRPLADEFASEGTPFVRPDDLSHGVVDFANCDRINAKALHRVRKGKGRAGDIAFTHRATVGRIARVGATAPDFVANPGVTLWRVLDQSRIDPNYLYYFMQTPFFMNQVWAEAGNTDTFPYISLTQQRGLAIRYPKLVLQRAIGSVLSALDDRIALLRETNTTLEAIAQALFKSWFIDFDPVRAKQQVLAPEGMDEATAALFPHDFAETDGRALPRGWRVCSIYDVAAVTYGAPFASSRFNTEGRGIGLVRIRDLKSELPGVFTEEIHPKGYLIQPGNIVVGMDGEFRAYLWGGEPSWLNQRLCVFSPINNASSAFVRMSIMPLLAAVEASETATTVIHLGKNDIDRFRVVMPDIPVLQAFGELVTPVYEKMVQCKQMASILASLRDTLLPRLISGQLRLPVAEELIEEFA